MNWFDVRQDSAAVPPAISPLLLAAVLTVALVVILLGAAALFGFHPPVAWVALFSAGVVVASTTIAWWRDRPNNVE